MCQAFPFVPEQCPQLAKSGCEEIKDDVYLIRNLKEIYMHGILKKKLSFVNGY